MTDNVPAEALAALDRLLAERPGNASHLFGDAVRALVAWRDAQIGHHKPDRHLLTRINATISVVLGGEYPLGEPNWHVIELARGDLAARG